MRFGLLLSVLLPVSGCGDKSGVSSGNEGSSSNSNSSPSSDDTGDPKPDDTGGPDPEPDDTGDVEPLPCEEREPSIEIGTGDVTFEPLSENEPVVMVHGPQGGWHMLGSVRTHSMHNVIEVHFTVTDLESSVVVADNRYRVAVVEDGDCTGYYPGMYGYLNVADLVTEHASRPPEVLGYKIVQMRMEVVDYEGRSVTETLMVTAQPDPVDLESLDVDTGSP